MRGLHSGARILIGLVALLIFPGLWLVWWAVCFSYPSENGTAWKWIVGAFAVWAVLTVVSMS